MTSTTRSALPKRDLNSVAERASPFKLEPQGGTVRAALEPRSTRAHRRRRGEERPALAVARRRMAERLVAKCDGSGRLEVFPPWPHEDHLEVIPHEENPFRKQHNCPYVALEN